MYGYIFKATTPEGLSFIGRKQGKFRPNYLGHGFWVKDAVAKWGRDAIQVECLEEVTNEEIFLDRHTHYIKQYDTIYPNGLNFNGVGKFGAPNYMNEDEQNEWRKQKVDSWKQGKETSSFTQDIFKLRTLAYAFGCIKSDPKGVVRELVDYHIHYKKYRHDANAMRLLPDELKVIYNRALEGVKYILEVSHEV